MRRLRNNRAFTLLEVMLSLGIFAIVSYLLMEMLARQSRTYTVVDNVSEAQQSVRAVANLIEQEVRSTGFLVPEGGVFCGYDTLPGNPDTDPDVLYVTDAEALTPPAPAAMNTVREGATVTVGGATVGAAGSQTFTLVDPTNPRWFDAGPSYDVSGDTVNDSDFRVPGGVIVFDRNDPAKGVSCGQITNVNLGGNTVTVDFTSGGSVPANGVRMGAAPYSALAMVPAHGYWIRVVGGVPRLLRDGAVMAEDVEDLQFATFMDAPPALGAARDGIVNALGAAAPTPWHDAAEYPGSNAVNSRYIPGALDHRALREVRVTVVSRTRSQDPDTVLNPALANFFPQQPENRVFAAAPPADGFRRRAITMTIAPRNVLLK